ncbi:MAG: hypothetical protein OQK98_13485 [Gammaproteobacteria bacterium]|nr:hypothetical protein [Gammaproteobacteria bacterium]
MAYKIKSLLIITLLLMSYITVAGPLVKVCLNDDCKKPTKVEISNACWSQVKDIFSSPFPTLKDEQDNILTSISLIESDIYQSISKSSSETDTANDLYTANSIKNTYRNTKHILGILLDQHMVKHHYVRKTITKKSWLGFESYGLLLQSLTDSNLYILETNNSELGKSGIIKNYSNNSYQKSNTIKVKTTPAIYNNNDDLE